MSKVTFQGHIVFCKDLAASARFYAELLGFTQEWKDDQHVSLAVPVSGDTDATVNLFLHVHDAPSPVELGTFAVDEVDALVARARADGYRVTTEPGDTPWGTREAGVADPDGNGIYLTGPLRSAS